MVYSNSGSMGVVLEPLVTDEGEEYMFYAFVLAGIIQIVLGFLGVAKLLRLMPVSVMIGFVNGLAIVLFLAQMKNFQTGSKIGEEDEGGRRRLNSFSVFTDGSEWMSGDMLLYTLLVTVVTMVTIVCFPLLTKKLPKALSFVCYIPPILVGIIVATIFEMVIVRVAAGFEGTQTLDDIAKIDPRVPNLAWFDSDWTMPSLDGDTFSTVLPTAISLMAVGLVESLMTVRLVNEITGTSSNIHREAIVGGVGNLVAGAFGGQGGNSEIGLTMVNLKSGGRTRVAATVSGLLVLIVVMAASEAINLIPLAGLVGVMLVIAFNTFDWASTWMVLAAALPERWRGHKAVNEKRISRADALIIVVVTVATPFSNLAIAVAIGIAVACIAFVWKSSELIDTRTYYRPGVDVKDPAIIKVYEIVGALFFASSENFLAIFDHRNDPQMVEVHFHTADIDDFSAMEALKTLGERYAKVGKRLRLRRIKKESLRVITKAQALMSEDLEVILEDEPELPGPAFHHNRESGTLYNYFNRDLNTRRYRHRSVHDISVNNINPVYGGGNTSTVIQQPAANGLSNGSNHPAIVRLMSAEV